MSRLALAGEDPAAFVLPAPSAAPAPSATASEPPAPRTARADAPRDDGPAIGFADVAMRFPDGTQALEGVSLRLGVGEFVSLVGPSGCGKSTLLRLAAGFERPSRGGVTTSGQSVGYVFQDATLLPWRSVRHNVELPAQLGGLSPDERRRRATEAIRRVGLAGFEEHRPAQLSGGMRMRASIARALTMQPKLFLFDEPFGALDEITRERLHEELLALFVADPFAGLFVTHSVPEAVFLSSRVIVMSSRPGRIVADLAVPFAYPRPPELRYSPAFAALAGQISATLREVSR
jgi:NitT/TauT family transport system ATP-binding protein